MLSKVLIFDTMVPVIYHKEKTIFMYLTIFPQIHVHIVCLNACYLRLAHTPVIGPH